jgi:hypothetical protein
MIDDPLLSETNVEGSLFDPTVMAELKRKHETGLWFWLVDWEIVLMRDLAFQKA